MQERRCTMVLRSSCFCGLLVLCGSPLLGKECTAQRGCKRKTEGSRGRVERRGGATSVELPGATAVPPAARYSPTNHMHIKTACSRVCDPHSSNIHMHPLSATVSDSATDQTPTMATCSTACIPGLACRDGKERERQ